MRFGQRFNSFISLYPSACCFRVFNKLDRARPCFPTASRLTVLLAARITIPSDGDTSVAVVPRQLTIPQHRGGR
jgi:hypothetical protein